ncbi:MAG: C69 family dipeptidase [Bacteroidales bacterium]
MKHFLTLTLIAALSVTMGYKANACTNFMVTKGASKDGSNFVSYSADSHVLYGELYHWKAAKYPAGTMLDIYEWDSGKYKGQIEQALETYNVVGNMNEHQLAIAETTYGGRYELVDTTGIMDYGSLIYITLQRAKTAREAIDVIADLVAKYGYASSGESFSISDPNEIWYMEIIGKGSPKLVTGKNKKTTIKHDKGAVWVAIRIPDGYVSGHANQARIHKFNQNDPENCIYSPDVISFARENGYFEGEDKDFSFCDAYAPIDFGAARFCEARVWSGFNRITDGMDKYLDYAKGENLTNKMPLYVKPNYKLSRKEVFGLMRDYYQDTDLDMSKDIGGGPYNCIVRWRPMTWKVDGVEYFHERATSTQQTGFVFVAESRPAPINTLGGIIWFGVDDTYTTVFTPMYSCMTRVPIEYAVGNGNLMEFSDNAAFWVFNQVSNLAYTRYSDMIKDIQPKQSELEEYYFSLIPVVDKIAQEKYAKNPEEAIEFLTNFSVSQGANTVREWKQLYRFLFTKYLDGNIKTPREVPAGYKYYAPKVEQPGYSEQYYRDLIKATGDKFKVIQH